MAIAPSEKDLHDVGRAEAILKRPDLVVRDFDITDFLMWAAAAMAGKCIQYASQLAAETYVDTSKADGLTTLADDHWAITRLEAGFATVTLSITRPIASAGAGTIFAGSVFATQKDNLGQEVRFVSDIDLTWGAAELGPKTVTATAEVAGRAGNVAATRINRILTTLYDPSFVVSNPAVAAGGSEAESDEALRERVRTFPSTIRRGILSAVEYGARTVTGVANATASEDDSGLMTVYVTDDSGGFSVSMLADVEVELRTWVAGGAAFSVQGGALFSQDVTVSLTVRTGTDVNALIPLIQSSIDSKLQQLKIGETLYRDMIKDAAISVARDKIVAVNVVLPAADIEPAAGELIRAGLITVS